MYDRHRRLKFIAEDIGVIEQLVPTLARYYPNMLSQKVFSWIPQFAEDRGKVVALTKAFWTEYFANNGIVDRRTHIGELGKNVDEREWQTFLTELPRKQIPTAMDEIFMRAKSKV